MRKATKIALTLVLIAVLLAVVSSFLWVKEEPKEVRFGCALSLTGCPTITLQSIEIIQ
jgi:hypothetical protein